MIKGNPLTDKQKQAISAFIKADKKRLANLKISHKKGMNRQYDITPKRVEVQN